MRALSVLPSILLLVGCYNPPGYPVNVGTTSDVASDMGADPDLAPPADLAPSPDLAPTHSGSVLIESDATAILTGSYVYPVFADTPPDTTCATTVVGSCTLNVCPASGSNPSAPMFYGAGTITVTGGLYDATATPADDGSYPLPMADPSPLWGGSETLNVAASGGAVPAFTTSIQAAAPLTVSAPDASTLTTITRTQGLSFVWSGGADLVEIAILADGDMVNQGSIQCLVPAAWGAQAIKPSMLSLLPAGRVTMMVESVRQQKLVAGDWRVYVSTRSAAVDGAGDMYFVDATLQ